jgi:hypothetical protein
VKDLDHILVLLAALIVVLAAYCAIVLAGFGNPKFLEAAAGGLTVGIAGYAGAKK